MENLDSLNNSSVDQTFGIIQLLFAVALSLVGVFFGFLLGRVDGFLEMRRRRKEIKKVVLSEMIRNYKFMLLLPRNLSVKGPRALVPVMTQINTGVYDSYIGNLHALKTRDFDIVYYYYDFVKMAKTRINAYQEIEKDGERYIEYEEYLVSSMLTLFKLVRLSTSLLVGKEIDDIIAERGYEYSIWEYSELKNVLESMKADIDVS